MADPSRMSFAEFSEYDPASVEAGYDQFGGYYGEDGQYYDATGQLAYDPNAQEADGEAVDQFYAEDGENYPDQDGGYDEVRSQPYYNLCTFSSDQNTHAFLQTSVSSCRVHIDSF